MLRPLQVSHENLPIFGVFLDEIWEFLEHSVGGSVLENSLSYDEKFEVGVVSGGGFLSTTYFP